LNPKLVYINLKNSVLTSKGHITIAKINWLMLFTEIFAVYSEYHMKPINTLSEQNAELLNAKAGCSYNYHWPLRG
jgi:hypothetical protein